MGNSALARAFERLNSGRHALWSISYNKVLRSLLGTEIAFKQLAELEDAVLFSASDIPNLAFSKNVLRKGVHHIQGGCKWFQR